MNKTCSACRGRKVRCDGATPKCGPCSRARSPIECTYNSGQAASPTAGHLHRGGACLTCRRRKKRCDGAKPSCTTCRLAGHETECQYEEDDRRSMIEILTIRIKELEYRLEMYESPVRSSSSRLPSGSPLLQPIMVPSQRYPAGGQSGSQAIAPFTVSDSLFLQASIQSLTAISGASQAPLPYPDLNQLRSLFFTHRAQLGFHLREAKIGAIMRGDLSGTVVHPSLVYTVQLLGHVFYTMQHNLTVSYGFELDQLQQLSQQMQQPHGQHSPDPVTRVQIHNMLAMYFYYRRQLTETVHQLVKADGVLMQQRHYFFYFGLNSPRRQPSSDDVQEQVTALSSLVYFDKATMICLNLPSVTQDKYDGLLNSLPGMIPWIPNNNFSFLKARSAHYLQQSLQFSYNLSIHTNSGSNSPGLVPEVFRQSQLYDQYWNLVREISQHVALLHPLVLKSTFFNGNQGLSLKMAMMISKTALAELHRLLARSHPESRQKASDVSLEVISIFKGLKSEEYVLLDRLSGTCLTTIAIVLFHERSLSAGSHLSRWNQDLSTLMACGAKLGTIPFIENSLQALCDIATSGLQ